MRHVARRGYALVNCPHYQEERNETWDTLSEGVQRKQGVTGMAEGSPGSKLLIFMWASSKLMRLIYT